MNVIEMRPQPNTQHTGACAQLQHAFAVQPLRVAAQRNGQKLTEVERGIPTRM